MSTETAIPKRFFSFTGRDPMKMLPPNGDRYFMEIFDHDDEVMPSSLIKPHSEEDTMGWIAAIVISVGNGHRLDVADTYHVLPSDVEDEIYHETYPSPNIKIEDPEVRVKVYEADCKAYWEAERAKKGEILAASLGPRQPIVNNKAAIVRMPSIVPMFFIPGQEILVEKYSGREYKIAGRKFRTVNQVDCIQPTGNFFAWDEARGWVERDIQVEMAAAQKRFEEDARQQATLGRIASRIKLP